MPSGDLVLCALWMLRRREARLGLAACGAMCALIRRGRGPVGLLHSAGAPTLEETRQARHHSSPKPARHQGQDTQPTALPRPRQHIVDVAARRAGREISRLLVVATASQEIAAAASLVLLQPAFLDRARNVGAGLQDDAPPPPPP